MRTMIKGTAVKLAVKVQTGKDGFNRPIYTEDYETVENVLIKLVLQSEKVCVLVSVNQ